MVSDVLSEAVESIRRYLAEPVYKDVYAGATRTDLESLVGEMDAMRARLDDPPDPLGGETK